jgi:hypothetical protein
MERRRAIALSVAVTRIAAGAVLVAVPHRLGRLLLGPFGAERRAHVLLRAVGARDVVLGVHAARAAWSGERSELDLALTTGAFADGVDALAIAAAAPVTGWARATIGVVVAGGTSATQIVARLLKD